MINFRDLAKLTSAIPGFLDENSDNVSTSDILFAIEKTLKELESAKQIFDINDYSLAIVEIATISVLSYKENLFARNHAENLNLLNTIVNHVVAVFYYRFNFSITDCEFSKISSKAADIYFKNNKYGKLLNSLEASTDLIDFLLGQLSRKFAVHELDKKKVKQAINKIKDESILFAEVLITAKENNTKLDINFNI